jgi:hypothetical protein
MFLYGLFFISNIFDYISDYKKILKLRLLCKEFNKNIIYFLKLDNRLPFFQPRSVSISDYHCWNCHQKKGLEYIQFEDFLKVDDNFIIQLFVSCQHWECKFKVLRSYLSYLLSKNVVHSNIDYQNTRVAIKKNDGKNGIVYINNENFLILKENRIQIKTFWYDKETPHDYNIKHVDLIDIYNDNKFLPDMGEFVFFSFYPSWVKKKHYLYIKEVVEQQEIFKMNAIYYNNSNEEHYLSEYYFAPFIDNRIEFYWLIQWISYKKAKYNHNNVCIYKILSATEPAKIYSLLQEYFVKNTMFNENELIIKGNILKFTTNCNISNMLLQNNLMIIDTDDMDNKRGLLIMQVINELKYRFE